MLDPIRKNGNRNAKTLRHLAAKTSDQARKLGKILLKTYSLTPMVCATIDIG